MGLHTEGTHKQAVLVSLSNLTIKQRADRMELLLTLKASHPIFFIPRCVLL